MSNQPRCPCINEVDSMTKECSSMEDLKNIIRDIPDFPKKGIIFKDITTLLADAQSFQKMIDLLSHRYVGKKIDKVVGVEARGFIIGAALAYKLGARIV